MFTLFSSFLHAVWVQTGWGAVTSEDEEGWGRMS